MPPGWVWERDDLVGLVIVEGMLCRELALRDRHMLEVLGPGDVVRLEALGGRSRLGGDVRCTAATETTFLVLGRSFILAAARWPCLLATVGRRLEEQRVRLAVQGLIAHLPRAEHRVLLALWHLAGQWGRVTWNGTELPLVITHDVLGQLTRSRRPTVTLAVTVLEAEGYIRRLDDGSWLLTDLSARAVEAIGRTSKSARALGETFMLRQLIGETSAESAAVRGEARQILVRGERTRARALSKGNHPRHRNLTDQVREATGRAATAARAAQAAQARAAEAHARAAEAHARAAEAHEDSARLHEHAAKVAADHGDAVDAVRYREVAVLARAEANRSRAAADDASQE